MLASTFRWLDSLEHDFDRQFVELDLILAELEDPEQQATDLILQGRRKMSSLCSAFAQLSEKAQTVFHCNLKLEAQLQDLRHSLATAASQQAAVEAENRALLVELQRSQTDELDKKQDERIERVRQRLDEERERLSADDRLHVRQQSEIGQLQRENSQLRKWLLTMQGDVFGARLTAKYLDKELAGRIQQIQLLARDCRGPEHDQLWAQLEAEIHLHRHKTVAQACRRRRRHAHGHGGDVRRLRAQKQVGVVRSMRIDKSGENLGISITGGFEHGVPILVSEVVPGGAAAGRLVVGDALLSVDGRDLRRATHRQAVEWLSTSSAEVELQAIYVDDESTSDDEDEHFFDEDELRNRIADASSELAEEGAAAASTLGVATRIVKAAAADPDPAAVASGSTANGDVEVTTSHDASGGDAVSTPPSIVGEKEKPSE